MKTNIENVFKSEMSKIYSSGYDDGYNDGVNKIYSPKLNDPDYLDGYNDGQTDSSEYYK